MRWKSEWVSLKSQVAGVADAFSLFLHSGQASVNDVLGVLPQIVLPESRRVFLALGEFFAKFTEEPSVTLANEAWASPDGLSERYKQRFLEDVQHVNRLASATYRVAALKAVTSQLDCLLADSSQVIRSTTERAFAHLQRLIVADEDVRTKWSIAFDNEPACEKLGGVHLLWHGIWGFKVDAKGERTDLILCEPLEDLGKVERVANGLVLTEWKRVTEGDGSKVAQKAREQAALYSVGSLFGLELLEYRYIVLVSKRRLICPADVQDGLVTYRHVNIAIDPSSPSVDAKKR